MKTKLGIILVILIFTTGKKLISQDFHKINITVKPVMANVRVGEHIKILIILKNTGNNIVEVLEPSVALQTVQLKVSKDGKIIDPQVHWQNALPEKIRILTNEFYEIEYDLTKIYPFLFEPGLYSISARYFPDQGTEVISNPITIELLPLSGNETKAKEAYMKVLGAGEYTAVANLGKEFIRNFPKSLFINKVRMETAIALCKIDPLEECSNLYLDVINSKIAATWEKNEALWRLAHVYYDRGDRLKAIDTLKNITNEPFASELLKEWINEEK